MNKDAPMSDAGPKRQLRTGYFVFGGLAAVKVIEYLIANSVGNGNWRYLAVLALVSAWLIIYYYKHIRQLWRSEGRRDG